MWLNCVYFGVEKRKFAPGPYGATRFGPVSHREGMELLEKIAALGISGFEAVGVAVILAAGLRGVADCLRRSPSVRLRLAQGMALGLEFKLGSEILRTVMVRDFGEIALVGAIILLRAALTFLIHWEIRAEGGMGQTHSGQ